MTNPLAWLIWLCAAGLSAWNGRNPFLLVLLLLIITAVRSAYPQRSDLKPPVSVYWFMPLAALLNGLWTHAGDTVLLQLPETLPLIGGPITAEALAYGALNGMALLTLFGAFAVVQSAIPISEIISLIPRALHPITVVIVITLTYLPFALRQAGAVRDAQAVRGHAVRNLRDWLPLLMPMLAGALEHAMQLAEAMSARGYGRSSTSARGPFVQLMLVVGMLGSLTGWIVRTATTYTITGWILTIGGVVMVTAALWLLRTRAPRTSFRKRVLRLADIVGIIGACAAATAMFAPLPGADLLAWNPYPTLRWPDFEPLAGILLCGLCAPIFFAPRKMSTDEDPQ